MTEDVRIGEVITKTAVLESRLDGHEDICAKRYGEIATAFGELKTKLGSIESRMNGALVTLVLLLTTALGTVLWAKLSGD
jgi:hypothetical protein|tara:strand:+ start:90 stop:329 length:240 start_codon:yes stop_codon:yes gene_type:complete